METKTISKIQIVLFVILALLLIWLFFAPKSYGQSRCDKDRIFIGGFSIEANKKFPTVTSAYLGVSGTYGMGTPFDNFTATVGVRFDDAKSGYKVKPEETIVSIPVFTTMYRMRMNGADLSDADLTGANLTYADLRCADLSCADLRDANLTGAKEIPAIIIAQIRVCAEGDIFGYKKCFNGVIVKLLIPKEAKRNNAFGRKCRAEYAVVVEIIGADVAISNHDNSFTYKVGDTVRPTTPFDEDFTNECSTGIHFFITLEEAKNY